LSLSASCDLNSDLEFFLSLELLVEIIVHEPYNYNTQNR